MGKNKLQKFSEMEQFPHVFQYTFASLQDMKEPFEKKGKWAEFFKNDNPIVLELGCGKGEYTVALAELFPEKNFIGVDIKGARMWTGAKDSYRKGLKNVAFIRTNIEIINVFFDENEVSEIWLTFPDPQMKKVRKRLTSTRFMQLYQQLLKDGGLIHLKTDSNFMFTYTCEMVKANGYQVDFCNADLYHSDFSDDKILSIKTAYEQQWLDRGLTIKYLKYRLMHKSDFVEPDVDIEYDSYRSYNRSKRSEKDSSGSTINKTMDLKSIQNLIERRLASLDLGKEPKGLYEPISYELSLGGKRLRPACSLLACQMFGGDVREAFSAAIAVETFHNFTLLHDDIMDKADKRRGKPTVHKVWNENTAILSGDAMLTLAYQILAECRPNVLKKLLDIFSKTAMEVYEGQQFDMDFETRDDVAVEEYMEMIRLKTAVLLAASLKMGAICGGASETDAQLLYDFGINVGLAFQLKDDWLDVYGDSETFGKNIGGDICCNKKTFMLISALAKADAGTKVELQTWIDKEEFDREEKVSAVTAIYDKLEISELAEKEMREYFQKAMEALGRVSVPDEQKQTLSKLANDLLYRDK